MVLRSTAGPKNSGVSTQSNATQTIIIPRESNSNASKAIVPNANARKAIVLRVPNANASKAIVPKAPNANASKAPACPKQSCPSVPNCTGDSNQKTLLDQLLEEVEKERSSTVFGGSSKRRNVKFNLY
jgi:hypothetical protein